MKSSNTIKGKIRPPSSGPWAPVSLPRGFPDHSFSPECSVHIETAVDITLLVHWAHELFKLPPSEGHPWLQTKSQ